MSWKRSWSRSWNRTVMAGALALTTLTAPVALGYDALGEVQSEDSSASFDASQVVGPQVTMARSGDGRWVGRLKGIVIDASETKNGLKGSNVALYLERVKEGDFIVRGNIGDRTVHVHVPGDARERYQLRWTLKGMADAPNAPVPQLILATIAALD